MTIKQGRIDVHHHIIPPAFVEEMQRRGLVKVAGASLPKWTPSQSVEIMNANGIQTAITSLSAPGVYFGNKREAVDLARRCNEFSAEMRTRYPGRFGSFAVLPMPFTDPAIAEAIYALDHPHAEGVVLLGSTDGVFLGDPCFDELMEELNRRSAIVFEHPNIYATSEQLGLGTPGFMVEFLCDTTRAAVNLILSGTLEKYPRIRWILSHSGRFLPYIAWRVSLANCMPEYAQNAPQGILNYIQRFYYDTALSPSAYSLAALRELVEPSHILFGSDFPFAPAPVVTMCCQTLGRSPVWNDEIKYGIGRGDALSLFPHLKMVGESVTPAPIYQGESLKAVGRRLIARSVARVLDRVRSR
jgi:predicted TIM-barrel fold metal-dependent hydrolase